MWGANEDSKAFQHKRCFPNRSCLREVREHLHSSYGLLSNQRDVIRGIKVFFFLRWNMSTLKTEHVLVWIFHKCERYLGNRCWCWISRFNLERDPLKRVINKLSCHRLWLWGSALRLTQFKVSATQPGTSSFNITLCDGTWPVVHTQRI